MDIWFCGYEKTKNNDFNLDYIKLMYKDIKKEETNDYIDYLCKDLKYNDYKIIDDYVILNDKYCLFVCESECE